MASSRTPTPMELNEDHNNLTTASLVSTVTTQQQQQQQQSTTTNAEFWSVARLSLDRNEMVGRVPFYRDDISKHFQVFRHGESTHTHSIG